MADSPSVVVLAPQELRRMFNEGRFWERARSGEFRQVVWKERHPSSPRAPEPRCTLSQFIKYFDDDGREAARVHQYLRRDGSLGGSGRPDPKLLVLDGITYKTPDARSLPE